MTEPQSAGDYDDRTTAAVESEELRVDIDHPRWAVKGGSKAKRLRYYLRTVNPNTVRDTLNALWEYREASSVTRPYPDLDDRVRAAFSRIVERFGGTPVAPEVSSAAPDQSQIAAATASSLV